MPDFKNRKVFLSAFRGFALVLAVAQIIASGIVADLPVVTFVIIGLVAIYTLIKILIPFRWYQKDMMTYLVLASDLLVCSSLLFFTGSISSPFLMYSLNPILTIALMLGRNVALSASTIVASSGIASQLLSTRVDFLMTPILSSSTEYLSPLVIYIMVCYLSALLPFLINDRARIRIESQATIDERNRLAREMHDNLAQSIGYLKLKTHQMKDALVSSSEKATAELSEIMFVIDQMYTELRESLGLLRINSRDNIDLITTLQDYIDKFGDQTGMKVDFRIGSSQLRLSTLADLHILRLVQEGLNNVRKHAEADSAEVRLDIQNNWTELSIKDDGKGFNASECRSKSKSYDHMGLKMMQERAEVLGGTMIINTSPGHGTELLFLIPMNRDVMKNGQSDKITVS